MRGRAVLVVLLVLLTACGSRVNGQQTGVEANGSESATGDEFSVPSGDDGGVSGGIDTSVSSGGAVSGGGSSVRTTSGSSGGGTSSSSGGGSVSGAGGEELTASAPGITATEMKIGIVYDKSAGFTNAALGYAGIGQIDQKRSNDALIADVNKRGGVAGRKLVPVYATFDSSGPDAQAGTEVLEQRFCQTFKENRIFVSFYGGAETFTRCMNELGVIRVDGGFVDEQLLAESPLVVNLNVTLDRLARFTVDRLFERGYYKKGRDGLAVNLKIGLLRYDLPEYERAAKILRAQLEKHGLKLTDEIAVRRAETTDQIGDETNAYRAAALKMKSDGITHVQFLTAYSALPELIFMQSSEKQVYNPRYGLNSTSSGQALSVLLGSDAQNQLHDAVEVGWFPIFDVHASDYSGDKTTVAFRHCKEVLEKSGERFTEGDPTRNKEALAASLCDGYNYLEAAANGAGANPTNESFMRIGVPSVENLDSAMTFILSTKERRDAYGGIRDARWFDDCSCFKYESPTIYRV